jgi:hypothetical protein
VFWSWGCAADVVALCGLGLAAEVFEDG